MRRALPASPVSLIRILLIGAVLASCASSPDTPAASDPSPATAPGATQAPGPLEPPAATEIPTAPKSTISQASGPSTLLAFSELYEGNTRPRWDSTEVSLRVATPASQLDMQMVQYVADTLAPLQNVPRLYTTGSDADVDLHFLPKSRWAEIGMDSAEQDSMRGYTRYEAVSGAMVKAVVVVDSDLTQVDRNRTIVHELLHAYGLGHHSCKGAMLYGSTGYDPHWRLQPYDLAMMTAWHATDPFAVLQDLPCPEVQYEQVSIDSISGPDEPVWCSTDSAECYSVSSSSGPRLDEGATWWRTDEGVSRYDPSRFVQLDANGVSMLCVKPSAAGGIVECEQGAVRQVSSPDWWYDGSVVYDYDPRTHLAFSFENRRLLCEIPVDAVAPCQFTAGASLVGSSADAYTDGRNIFKQKPGS